MVDQVQIAEVFLHRAGTFLIVQRAGGRGKGYWMIPGGLVEANENVETAAKRETLEETGLAAAEMELLRRWSWQHPADDYVREIATFLAPAPAGEVRLSPEHTAYDWLTPADYIARYCSERLAEVAPEYAGMFLAMRENCAEVARRVGGLDRRDHS